MEGQPASFGGFIFKNHVLSLLFSICVDYFVSLEIISQECYLHKNGLDPSFL